MIESHCLSSWSASLEDLNGMDGATFYTPAVRRPLQPRKYTAVGDTWEKQRPDRDQLPYRRSIPWASPPPLKSLLLWGSFISLQVPSRGEHRI